MKYNTSELSYYVHKLGESFNNDKVFRGQGSPVRTPLSYSMFVYRKNDKTFFRKLKLRKLYL